MSQTDRNREAYILSLQNDKEHLRKMHDDTSKLYKILEKQSRDFCNAVLGEQHAMQQIGGADITSSMDIFSFMKYAFEKYKESVKSQKQLLMDLTKTIKLREAEVESLKDQLLRYQVSGAVPAPLAPEPEPAPVVPSKVEVLVEEFDEDESRLIREKPSQVNKTFNDKPVQKQVPQQVPQSVEQARPKVQTVAPTQPVQQTKPVQPQVESVVQTPEVSQDSKKSSHEVKSLDEIIKESQKSVTNQTKESVAIPTRAPKQPSHDESQGSSGGVGTPDQTTAAPIAHMVNLVDLMSNISDIGWLALEAIGIRGKSIRDDIYNDVWNNNPGVSNDAVIKVLREMEKMGILGVEKIACGVKWFYVYDFTKSGERIFFEKYRRNVVEGEKGKLVREHSSAKHGYFIKQMATILEEQGYQNVCTSRKENRITLPNDRALIPDIICDKDGKKYYFEMEIGNHNQIEFNSKCDKIKSVTNEILFVVPETNAIGQLQSKFEGWIKAKTDANGGISLKGVSIYLGTAKQLKTKSFSEWAYVQKFS